MDMNVTAEGVKLRQLEQLRALKCEYGQDFFSKAGGLQGSRSLLAAQQ